MRMEVVVNMFMKIEPSVWDKSLADLSNIVLVSFCAGNTQHTSIHTHSSKPAASL